MAQTTDPAKNRAYVIGLFGWLATIGTTANLIKSGLNFWMASRAPFPNGTTQNPIPIALQTIQAAAKEAFTDTMRRPIHTASRIPTSAGARPAMGDAATQTAAGSVLGFSSYAKWGLVGLVALSALYIAQRYWKGSGNHNTNTNNNNINISIHFNGIHPSMQPIVTNETKKGDTNIHLTMEGPVHTALSHKLRGQ